MTPPLRSQVRRVAAVLLAATIPLAGACGGDDEPADTTTTSSTTTTGDGSAAEIEEAWNRTAAEFRDRVGERFDVECPAGGTLRSAWGTNEYTYDSSVCTAGVHVGLITVDEGGEVTIEILDGQDEYVGSVSNGVETSDYGPWGGSFSFPDAEPLEVDGTIAWDRTAVFYKGRSDVEFTVECEAGGTPGSVWGTDVYTEDSSICTAAQHAGLITAAEGGEVTFELIEGQESYEGSAANGVTSRDYRAYGGSFRFVES